MIFKEQIELVQTGLGALLDPVTLNPVGTIQSKGSKLSPTASITVEPLDGLQVFAKYVDGFRPPSIRELADPVVTFVTPNLKPEEAKNWEDYNVVDFFGSYEVSENMEFNFSVDNAFDRFYMDALNTSAMPAPGRTFRASLTTKF